MLMPLNSLMTDLTDITFIKMWVLKTETIRVFLTSWLSFLIPFSRQTNHGRLVSLLCMGVSGVCLTGCKHG